MKLIKQIRNVLNDPERKLNERVFILLVLVAIGMLFIALIGDGIYNRNPVEILAIIALIIIVPLITYAGIRFNKLDVIIKLTSLFIMIAITVVYMQAGGAEGAAILWFVFYYMYIGLVMTGWWRTLNLLLLTVMVGVMFAIEYLYPGLFKPYTRWIFYIDTSLAVIEIGFVCFAMTWFQNRQFMEENRRAKEETRKVEELIRSQNRFFSSMSHEIRTPINSILGLNEIILRQEDASDEIVRDAENIQGAGRMLLALINDILDFSKIEAGRMDIVPINYSVSSMLSEIVNMIWLYAQQKGLEFKIEVDPTIPTELFGDEVRIKQILVNLLNNAVKYTKEGSVTLHIEKEDTTMDSVLLLFSVIDTGMGIKQDAIPYLFDAFQRLDEQKTVGIEGTGLGLSIVKQLVDLMDGRITVNSVYTQGSTFMVELWQKVTNSEAVGEISIAGLSVERSENRYQAGFMTVDARILVVDDNEMNLEVEKKLLSGTGLTVDTVLSGEEALSMTLSTRYDLILMDHLMPGMDGVECMQFIRKQSGGLNNNVPIIVLTANAGSENRELYAGSGFDGYLVKPVTGHQLEEAVLHHLPGIKVIRRDVSDSSRMQMNTSGNYSHKIPILVTTSSTCDLPAMIIEEQQIDTIPYSIYADDKVFYDSMEAGADEVLRYMKTGMVFKSEPPTVSEFEDFFGKELKKAHNVIYIAVSSLVNNEYETALEASRAYDNVRVFDSGSITAGLGLMVILAHRMSIQGMTSEKIIGELEAYKTRMQISFITNGAYFSGRQEFFKNIIHNIIKTFVIRPIVKMSEGKYGLGSLSFGADLMRSYAKYIDYALPRFVNPDLDLLMAVYVDQSEEELKHIEEHIRKRYDFEHIVFVKASATFALNSGSGSLGLIYFTRGEQGIKLSQMVVSKEEEKDDTTQDVNGTEDIDKAADTADAGVEASSGTEVYAVKNTAMEKQWYESIPGVNGEKAMENSGSEDTLREILQIFYDSIGSKSDEIQGFYDSEDWENYTIKVHALKSSARIIGADKLADDALAMENAGKEKNISYIRSHNEELLKDYRAYADNLGPVVVRSVEKKPADSVVIEIMYDTIREAIRERDPDTIRDAFKEIEQYELPAADVLRLEQLRDFFEDGDYDGLSLIMETFQG